MIKKFRKLVFEEFHIDVVRLSTLSSVAFKIFLSNFYYLVNYKGNKIDGDFTETGLYKTHYELYQLIKKAYYGGSVNVSNLYHEGELYCYDVNSLYPAMMLKDCRKTKIFCWRCL